jgi:hypothetical protein
MIFSIDADGWFSSIGGKAVHRRDLTTQLPGSAMPWTFGKPIGILWHYTDGFQGDISGSMIANGFITAQLSIGRDGAIYQYADIFTAHWHAFAASQWGVGVEHEAHPPDSNLTDVQLQTSAEVYAAIIEAVKAKFGNDIPVAHILGCDLTHPGLKEHADGLGCSWDPKGHSDKLFGWGWPKYLNAITTALEGDDMTPEDKAALKKAGDSAQRFEDYLDGEKLAVAGKPLPNKHSDAMAAGFQNANAFLNQPKPGTAKNHKHVPGGVQGVAP